MFAEEITKDPPDCHFVRKLAFPEREDCPTGAFQGVHCGLIPLHVASELSRPVFEVGRRHLGSGLASVAMPKAPMDEDG